jgi:uncharacterized protein YjbI with pentapeptide repeats
MRGRALGSITAFCLTTGLLSAGLFSATAAPASAATCPTVGASGLVTPAPSAGVDWSGCDLTGADLASADLASADLASADLSGASFTDANLADADLNSATVTNADFTGATLTGVQSGGIPGGPAGVVTLPADWSLVSGYLLGPGADLAGAVLDNLDFTVGVDLAGATLTDANLSNSAFAGTDFDDADLSSANLTSLTVSTGASMASATLTDANLTDAELTDLDMSGDQLTGATLTGWTNAGDNLTDADLEGDTISSGIGGNLTDANLTDTTIGSGVSGNLSGANFEGATFENGLASSGITGQPLNLPAGWTLSGGFLLGPYAELSSANLSGVDMSDANLSNAILDSATLTGANITGTTLTGATLTLVTSGGLTGTPAALPADWSVAAGYLLGPQANVTDANLSGANLTDANLEGANLQDSNLHAATLTGANLTGLMSGVQSGGLTTSPASLPEGWFEADGYLVGPGADDNGATLTGLNITDADIGAATFVGADLSGDVLPSGYLDNANFTNANLTGIDLEGAVAEGVNLTGADLAAANITNAELDYAIWSSTTCPDGTSSNADSSTCTGNESYLPAAHPGLAGTQGTNGWYISPVTVTWNWASPGATLGTSGCPATSKSSAEGSTVTVTGTCTNSFGNTGQATVKVKIDTAAPSVSVTGVQAGHQYAVGHVPAPRCKTTDAISGVATQAAVKVTGTSSGGIGSFTATCSGAVNGAGIRQAKAVSVTYYAGYGLSGFVAPKSGATFSTSGKAITVEFQLAAANGKALSSGTAAGLAKDRKIRVTLTGPRISPVNATCAWNSARKYFQCTVTVPRGVLTGKSHPYAITVTEIQGKSYLPVAGVGRATNPETLYFR